MSEFFFFVFLSPVPRTSRTSLCRLTHFAFPTRPPSPKRWTSSTLMRSTRPSRECCFVFFYISCILYPRAFFWRRHGLCSSEVEGGQENAKSEASARTAAEHMQALTETRVAYRAGLCSTPTDVLPPPTDTPALAYICI